MKSKTTFQFKENDDPIDIRKDNVFKAVFTKSNRMSRLALTNLISALIGKEIIINAIHANEPPVESLEDRQIRFDINCRAKTGEYINVEMSLNPDPFEPVRLEYYTGKLFTSQGIKGIKKSYRDLKQTYQIAILSKNCFFHDKEFFHTFLYYDPIRATSLNGRTRIITLELSKLGEIVEKPTEKMSATELWAFFLQYLTDMSKRSKINEIINQEEGLAMASQVLMKISKDEAERFRLLSEEKYQLDLQSKLVHAERKGEQKGERKGVRKGIQKGEQKVKKIINLLKNGTSPEDIIKLYGR
jgi:predicted transposase/invertase (TIGR01784 family)